MLNSFLWHDYETFGTDPATDWPAQFAAIRTDSDLNEVGEPVNIFCRLPEDHLPHPKASLITGITPQQVNSCGLPEREFIQSIQNHFMVPGTCGVGFNNIRFDDEVTRHSLYRNFYDPYAREWKNGNSRWDILDTVRLTAAVRPEGIIWPKRADGFNSYRLEELTEENGIEHKGAHDALSDVRATIAVARLIKETHPKLFHYVLSQKGKREASQHLRFDQPQPVIHVSGMFGAERSCLSLVTPLAPHPTNKNGIIVCDLMGDIDDLLTLSSDELQKQLFTPMTKTPKGKKIPLKVVHINKAPVLVPISVLRDIDKERLTIDVNECVEKHYHLQNTRKLYQKVQKIFAAPPLLDTSDPDQMLYSGGFFSDSDKNQMNRVCTTKPEKLATLQTVFDDKRLDKMLFRYRARNYPETLTSEEMLQWKRFCTHRLMSEDERVLGLKQFWQEFDTLKQTASEHQTKLLNELAEYIRTLQQWLAAE